MYTIVKRFGFSASHVLDGLVEGHPCQRLHGHNYEVELELRGPLDERGFVVDFRELDCFRQFLDDQVDHRHLNDVMLGQPSSERLARWLYECGVRLGLGGWLVAVRVSETPRTWAEYRS